VCAGASQVVVEEESCFDGDDNVEGRNWSINDHLPANEVMKVGFKALVMVLLNLSNLVFSLLMLAPL
jgi:hypothetical protein